MSDSSLQDNLSVILSFSSLVCLSFCLCHRESSEENGLNKKNTSVFVGEEEGLLFFWTFLCFPFFSSHTTLLSTISTRTNKNKKEQQQTRTNKQQERRRLCSILLLLFSCVFHFCRRLGIFLGVVFFLFSPHVEQ